MPFQSRKRPQSGSSRPYFRTPRIARIRQIPRRQPSRRKTPAIAHSNLRKTWLKRYLNTYCGYIHIPKGSILRILRDVLAGSDERPGRETHHPCCGRTGMPRDCGFSSSIETIRDAAKSTETRGDRVARVRKPLWLGLRINAALKNAFAQRPLMNTAAEHG